MIERFHYLTQNIPGFSHAELARLACRGGARWVQLRAKGKPYDELLKIARETKLVCLEYGAKLIINDHVQVAKEISADGVHLGKDDMQPREARKVLGKHFLIGGSTNTAENAERMLMQGCNYIGVGPYSFTSTKDKLNPVLGLEGIKRMAEKFSGKIPMIAIGGIQPDDVESLMQTGIHGVAVSSAINLAGDKTRITRIFTNYINCLNPL